MGNSLNLGSLSNWLTNRQTSLAIDQMCRKNRIDQRRLAQARLSWRQPPITNRRRTHTDHIELKSPLEQLSLNLVCDRVKTNIACQGRNFALPHKHQHPRNFHTTENQGLHPHTKRQLTLTGDLATEGGTAAAVAIRWNVVTKKLTSPQLKLLVRTHLKEKSVKDRKGELTWWCSTRCA